MVVEAGRRHVARLGVALVVDGARLAHGAAHDGHRVGRREGDAADDVVAAVAEDPPAEGLVAQDVHADADRAIDLGGRARRRVERAGGARARDPREGVRLRAPPVDLVGEEHGDDDDLVLRVPLRLPRPVDAGNFPVASAIDGLCRDETARIAEKR